MALLVSRIEAHRKSGGAGSSLCAFRISSISGLSYCSLRILLTYPTVRGKRKVRTTTVSMTIESHQGAPHPWRVVKTSRPSGRRGGRREPVRNRACVVVLCFASGSLRSRQAGSRQDSEISGAALYPADEEEHERPEQEGHQHGHSPAPPKIPPGTTAAGGT